MKKSRATFIGVLSGLAATFHMVSTVFLMIFLPYLYIFTFVFIVAFVEVWGSSDTELIKAFEYDKAMWVSYDESAWFMASDDNEEEYGVRCIGRINCYGQWYDFVPNIETYEDNISGYVFPNGIDEAAEGGMLQLDEGIEIYRGTHSVDDYEYPTYSIDVEDVLDTNYILGDTWWIDFERLDVLSYSECYESAYSDLEIYLYDDDTFNLYIDEQMKQGHIYYEGYYVILEVSKREIYVFENYGDLIYNKEYSINDEKITDGLRLATASSEWSY